MIRGIYFNFFPQRDEPVLNRASKNVDLQRYIWQISDYEELPDDGAFPSETILVSGKELEQVLQSTQSRVIDFAVMRAYLSQEDIVPIKNYADYSASECQMIILIYDCWNVEIYAKDLRLAQTIFQNMKEAGTLEGGKLEYITDENEGRTRMAVW